VVQRNKVDSESQYLFSMPGEEPFSSALTPVFALQPRGAGTGQREALDSFLLRLAFSHRVHPRALFNDVLRTELAKQGHSWSSKGWQLATPGSMNGVGSVPSAFTEIIARLTSVNEVRFCSYESLEHVITRHGLIDRRERYCPQCLSEENGLGTTYKRLVWSTAAAMACPRHGQRLVTHRCGRNPPLRHPPNRVALHLFGVCRACHGLGYRCARTSSGPATAQEIWQASQVEQLVDALPWLGSAITAASAFDGIRQVAHAFGEGKPFSIVGKTAISKSTIHGWLHRQHLPNLRSLLNLCCAADVSLISVLSGTPGPSAGSPGGIVPCSVKRAAAEDRTPQNARLPVLEKQLRADAPKSLTIVAKELGITRRTLKQQAPELCTRIVQRYSVYRKEQHQARRRQLELKCEEAFAKLVVLDRPITRRAAEAVLGRNMRKGSPFEAAWFDVQSKKPRDA
jgi:hypothetical protein